MRVVLVTSKLNFETAGGSVADLHLKAKGLADLGHEVTVVAAFSQGNKINQSLPYAMYEESIPSARLLAIQRHAYRILKKYQHQADVFYIDGHIFLYGAGWYRFFGGKVPVVGFFNIRLNCWGDTQDTEKRRDNIFLRGKRRLREIAERHLGVPLANKLDAFIFNTPMVEKLYTDWGFEKTKSAVIEDLVDTTAIRQLANNQEAIVRHQAVTAPLILLCTGRMIIEKGFDLVIRALVAINDRERFRLIMSGTGPDRDRLMQLAAEQGLEKYIRFPGWVNKEQLTEFFKQAHVFVFPKWWIEYGSAVLTEAMAHGLPSIIPAGGALEWLSAGGALSFAPDSVDDLARQLDRLGADRVLRIQLAAGALKRAEALDCKKLARRLEETMRSVFVRG